MRLSDFLHIPASWIKTHFRLVELLDEYEFFPPKDISPVITQIKATPYEFLIKLAISNPVIDRLCKTPELLSHWETIWLASNSGNQSQPTMHPFELIKGTYLFLKYKSESVENPEHSADYLSESAKLGCFSAINEMCHQTLTKPKSGLELQDLENLLFLCQVAAPLHWTPGYLLLANAYLEVALIVEEKFRDTFTAFSHSTRYYQGALRSLYLAEYFEDFSGPAVRNAYGGKSLADIYKDTDLVQNASARQKLIHRYPLLKELDKEIRDETKLVFDKVAKEHNLNLHTQEKLTLFECGSVLEATHVL